MINQVYQVLTGHELKLEKTGVLFEVTVLKGSNENNTQHRYYVRYMLSILMTRSVCFKCGVFQLTLFCRFPNKLYRLARHKICGTVTHMYSLFCFSNLFSLHIIN